MRGTFALIIMLLTGAALAQTTAMYRTVSRDGTVTFSDLPLSDESVLVSVNVRPGAAAQPAAAEPAAPQTGLDEAARQAEIERLAADQAQIADNCEVAEAQRNSAMVTDRLYRLNAEGGREFLTPEEVAEARIRAQAEVDRWCD